MDAAHDTTAMIGAGSCKTSGGRISYKGGYKYQLQTPYIVETNIFPPVDVVLEYVTIRENGTLTVQEGYAWDGPSGPAIPTLTFMRGSLVHDALYQLMRDGGLDRSVYREQADQLLRTICLEDGMWRFRAWYVFHGVRLFGDPSADPANRQPTIYAPACFEASGTEVIDHG